MPPNLTLPPSHLLRSLAGTSLLLLREASTEPAAQSSSTLPALTQTLARTPTSALAPPGPKMDPTAKDEMEPSLPPGMSPSGWGGGGMWQERWEWWVWVLPARSGWSSISQ